VKLQVAVPIPKQIWEEQNGEAPGVGASAAADAVPLQDALRTDAKFRIWVEEDPGGTLALASKEGVPCLHARRSSLVS